MPSSSLDDGDHLLRRISPLTQAVLYQHPDTGDDLLRPPSDAFVLGKTETGLSFHVERLLRAAGEPLTYGCPLGVPGWGVVRIGVSTVRALGLTVVLDGIPYHALVLGLRDLGGNARRRKQKELAQASRYVVAPRAS